MNRKVKGFDNITRKILGGRSLIATTTSVTINFANNKKSVHKIGTNINRSK